MEKIKIQNTNIADDEILMALKDRDYVMSHVRLAVQKKSSEVTDVITHEVLNLQLFMRIRLDGCFDDPCITASTKVTNGLLDLSGISEEELWTAARRNTAKELVVGSMSEILFGEDMEEHSLFYVATTRDNYDGAAVIAFPELLRSFCQNHDVESCAVLPSSTQEMLLVPERDDMASYVDLAELVNSVNCTPGIVSDNIALDPVVYKYTLETNSIEIAAAFM